MPYARIDDQEWSAPETALAGNAAYGALCRMRGYCAAHQTDGYVPMEVAQMVTAGDADQLERLVRAGKVEIIEDLGLPGAHTNGSTSRIVKLVGWLDHNISKDEWAAMQATRSAAGRKAAKARWGTG